MDKTTQVYCTNCFYGEELLKELYNDTMMLPVVLPKNCVFCWPYNPEDSTEYELRLFYVEKEN